MTWFLASVSRKVRAICWGKAQQTSFRSKKFLFSFHKHEISDVVHIYISLWTNTQCQTDLLQIAGRFETPAICSRTQQDSSWVECASWLLLIPSWLEAYYVFLSTSHMFSLSFSCPFQHQKIMATQTPQPGESGSELSETTDTSSNVSLAGPQQQCRHLVFHHDAANAATANTMQNAHLQTVSKTRSTENTKQHVIGCD